MLYEINNKYYIKMGRKYLHVNIVLNDKHDDITLAPDKKDVIEINTNNKLKVKKVMFDKFKEEYLKNANNLDNDEDKPRESHFSNKSRRYDR